jgi:hypothetical protein
MPPAQLMQSSEGITGLEEAPESLSIPCHLLPGDHPYVTAEIANINAWFNQEHKAITGTAWLNPIWEMPASEANLYHMLYSVMSKHLGQ